MTAAGPLPLPLFSRWTSILLAALTGFLFYASFPGLDLWPLAFIAWIPWMLALQGASTRRAMLQGLAAGIVMGVLGFYWLLDMLRTFSGFPTWLCAIFMLIVCGYQAGRYALLGWLYARGTQRGWARGPVFAAAFASSEFLFPLLFHFYFGASVHEVYPIVQVAELGGPILVGLVTLAPSWSIASALTRAIELKRAGQRVGFSRPFREIGYSSWVPGLVIPLLAILYGMLRIVQVDEMVHDAPKVKVGIVQANMSLMGKRNDLEEGRKRHQKLTKKLVQRDKVDLVVWPETSIAGSVDEEQAADWYGKRVTKRLKVPTILGAILTRDVEDERGYILFNSALISDRNGKIQGRYDKHFLVPFSEFIPFGDDYPILYRWSPNSGHFSPGTTIDPLPFRDDWIATFICYEDLSPSFVNKLVHHENNPGLLVNMTNDAWFGDTSEPWEHMALSKLRAVEQRRFLVRSTNSGISGFVDPVGRLVEQTPTFKQAAISQDVAFLHSKTVYQVIGDIPWWLVSIISFIAAFLPVSRLFPRLDVPA